MKKLLFILLSFISLASYAQAEFPEGVQITGGQPTNTTPAFITTTTVNGLQEKIPSAYIEKTANKISTITGYSETLYPNEKATHDGLDAKLNISDLPSNLTLYATTAPSGISTYTKWVSTLNDPDYNTTAVNVSTGVISGTNQLISGLTSIGGQIIGNPGLLNVTTVGNIRRTSGTGTAKFYFELYKRTAAGVESFLGVSDFTLPVDFNTYAEFSATAVWNDGVFTETDRIVIKFYGSRIAGGSDPTFDFQFGGLTPVRTIVPVPFRVLAGEYEVKINKVSTLTASAILYPNNNAVIAGLATKQNTLTNPITGTGTVNYIPKFTGSTTQGNSNITDNGTLVYTSIDMSINGVRAGRGGGNLSTNLAYGTDALRDNLTGTGIIAIGPTALRNNLNSNNLAIGTGAAQNGTISNNNLTIGNFSLLNNIAGINSTIIGQSAARYISDLSTSLTNVNSGLFIGILASPLANNSTNEIVIAPNGKGLGNNTTAIGNSSTLSARIWGRFLSGTSVDDGVNQGQFNGTVTASPATLSNQVVVKSQLDLKADLAGTQTFTGIHNFPTAASGTNTTQVASTAFVTNAFTGGLYAYSITRTDANLLEHRIFNNSATTVSLENNNSTGTFRQANNNSTGNHNRLVNESTGIANVNRNNAGGIFNSNINNLNTGIFNQSLNSGTGIFNENTNSTTATFSDSFNTSTGTFDKRRNDSTGILNYYNSSTGSTGDLQQYLKNGVVTSKINHLGEITVPKITNTGIQEYADNAAAITAGLSVGTHYRTGDLLKIVH